MDGVDFMHKKGIAHRDLKLENCFPDENLVLKIADFGSHGPFEKRVL